MRREVKSSQRGMLLTPLRITSNVLAGDSQGATLSAGVGVYTLTWTNALARAPIVVATCRTALRLVRCDAPTSTGCVIRTFALDGTTASNSDLEILVLGSETSTVQEA